MKAIDTLGLAVAAMILFAAPAWAVDEHHQAQPGQAAQAPQAAQPGQAQQPGAVAPQTPGMGMMGAMMGGMMVGMGPGGDQVGPLDRVEGRIAFLRAELKIGEPQTQAWTGFADALRGSAKKLAELPRTPPAVAGAAPTLSQRLEHQEHVLAVRLEAVKSLRAALQRLHGVLSDEQKKTAEELLPAQGGMMRLGVI